MQKWQWRWFNYTLSPSCLLFNDRYYQYNIQLYIILFQSRLDSRIWSTLCILFHTELLLLCKFIFTFQILGWHPNIKQERASWLMTVKSFKLDHVMVNTKNANTRGLLRSQLCNLRHVASLEVIGVAWIYGLNSFCKDIACMLEIKIGWYVVLEILLGILHTRIVYLWPEFSSTLSSLQSPWSTRGLSYMTHPLVNQKSIR